MGISARERADRIDHALSGKQLYPFDWLNLPVAFDPEPVPGTEYYNRLTDGMKLANFVADAMSSGLRFVFRASAMSNGALAYDLADDYVDNNTSGRLTNIEVYSQNRFGRPVKTTQNLKNTVAGSELMNRVILPSREADYRAGNVLEERFPDMAAVYPIVIESAWRTQKSNPSLSQGATNQDWAYEYWWGLRVMRMSHHVYDGNKRFDSRNLNIEDGVATAIQCGFLDELPYRQEIGKGAEFGTTDKDGRPVTLADRAWGRAKHVFAVTERGFATDLAIATLLSEFAIDDWLRGEGAPVGFDPIDRERLHPVLANRDKKELKRMDRLKAIMLPYIAENCLDFLGAYQRDPNIKKYIEDKVLPAKERFKDLDIGKARKVLFSEDIVGDQNADDLKKAASRVAKTFEGASSAPVFLAKPAKRRDNDGKYFRSPARLFDDGHYNKLSEWEKAGLPFVMAAMESFRLPENAPRSLFYIAEPKGGTLAREYMEERGIDYLPEAYSSEDPLDRDKSFAKQVIEKNAAQIDKDVVTLAASEVIKARGIRNIVSTNDMIDIAAGMERYRNFVAADGPQKVSPRCRLAYMMEWLDRNPEAVAFRKDWQVHHNDIQLMIRSVEVALGLVKRPYNGGDYRQEIFTLDQKTKEVSKQDLHSIGMPLLERAQDLLTKTPAPPAREWYLAASRFIQMIDMLKDPGRMNYEYHTDPKTGEVSKNEIILWREADQELLQFWYEEPEKKKELLALADTVKQKILDIGVLEFAPDDLEGLSEDYKAAWQDAHGLNEASRRRKFDGRRTGQKWDGPV